MRRICAVLIMLGLTGVHAPAQDSDPPAEPVTTELARIVLAQSEDAVASSGSEGLVEVTGGSLFYRSMGSGPPVLLLHGYSLTSSFWTPYLAEFASRYRVVAFDLPGHGRSDRLRPTYSHLPVAKSILEAAGSLGISSFHVVGHSSGGLIALHMALLQPERVSSMVLMAAPWRIPDSFRQQESGLDPEGLQSWHPGGEEQVDWILQQLKRIKADPTEGAFRAEQLRQIGTRTLVVHGDRDSLLPVDTALGLATYLPHASLLILPDAGHELIMEPSLASRLWSIAVSEFLDRQTTIPR